MVEVKYKAQNSQSIVVTTVVALQWSCQTDTYYISSDDSCLPLFTAALPRLFDYVVGTSHETDKFKYTT